MILLRHVCVLNHFSPVRLFATPWTVASQAPLSMEFSKQENWSGLPFPPPRIFPTQGLNLHHYWVSYIACRFFTIEPPGKSYNSSYRSDFSKSGNRSCLPILVCFIPKIGFQSFCFLPLSRLLSSGQNVSHDGLMDNVSFCKTFI